jgi:lipoate-protein ligase A
MHRLDLTLDSPAENLALDEALLLDAEEGAGSEVLRFWLSPTPFVVVGIGARLQEEVFWDICQIEGVPVLRRCSGGGTVLQGPGCLNYALVLRIRPGTPTATITATNQFVMKRNAAALSSLLGKRVSVEGHTDLSIAGRKVSGNAQRRLRNHFLFHGTFLLSLDSALLSRLLPSPPRQPDYRAGRPHEAFVENLGIAAEQVKTVLARAWEADASLALDAIPGVLNRTRKLVADRYSSDEWNLRS